jgi:hypothetical protein
LNSTIIARIAAAAILGLVPVVQIIRLRGDPRERTRERQADGLALLVALLCSAATLIMVIVTVARARVERRMVATTVPVTAEVLASGVTAQRTGGRNASTVYEIWCDLDDLTQAHVVHTVRAGFPSRRRALDAWVDAHPRGTRLTLRTRRDRSDSILGFSSLVPATTTSQAAATVALYCAAGAALACSGAVLLRRRRTPR